MRWQLDYNLAVRHFSIKESLKFGWQHFKKRVWFFVAVVATVAFIGWLPDELRSRLPESAVASKWFYRIIGILVTTYVSAGFLRIILDVIEDKQAKYSDIFKNYKYIFNYWLAEFIAGAATVVGLVLFIVPGIILAIKFQFADYFVVDKNQNAIQALKSSWRITSGIKWNLFLFGLTLIGINILGMLALGVGALVTYPVTMIAQAHVYKLLTAKVNTVKTKKKKV